MGLPHIEGAPENCSCCCMLFPVLPDAESGAERKGSHQHHKRQLASLGCSASTEEHFFIVIFIVVFFFFLSSDHCFQGCYWTYIGSSLPVLLHSILFPLNIFSLFTLKFVFSTLFPLKHHPLYFSFLYFLNFSLPGISFYL